MLSRQYLETRHDALPGEVCLGLDGSAFWDLDLEFAPTESEWEDFTGEGFHFGFEDHVLACDA